MSRRRMFSLDPENRARRQLRGRGRRLRWRHRPLIFKVSEVSDRSGGRSLNQLRTSVVSLKIVFSQNSLCLWGKIKLLAYLLCGHIGCNTGNGKKLSSSQAQLGQATCLAAA